MIIFHVFGYDVSVFFRFSSARIPIRSATAIFYTLPVSDSILKEIIAKINKNRGMKLGFSSPVVEFFKFID